MLNRLSLQNYNRSVMHFIDPESRLHFELSPSYQRESVWDDNRRRDLIQSMLMGLPIGVVVTNHRGYSNEVVYGVVDGKQRLEALLKFHDNEFSVPADWFEDGDALETTLVDGVEYVFYGNLSKVAQRSFLNLPIPESQANVKGIPAEAEIFRLINSGGVAQTEETMKKAAVIENS